MRWAPGLLVLRQYQAHWLVPDITAGLVLSTVLAPVGIAYAVASGVGAVYGLYATIVPLLAYAVFGPSRVLVLGPDSSLAPLILVVVLSLAGLLVPVPLMALDLLTGAIQAYIFAVLSMVFIASAVSEDDSASPNERQPT
jgi:MFS superfamily sulfate permease-like transporter